MRLVILHYHIFKNAGSTVEDILEHSFGERFGTLETAAGSGLVSDAELTTYLEARPEIRAFSSHQIRHPLPQVPGYLFFDICFLRDPLDRLRSFYDYFRQRPNPSDPMSELANRCQLGDFAAGMIEEHSLFIRNNQVNLLACAGDSDEPNERDLGVAVRRMLATSFLGVVDRFGQSAVAGAAALRAAFPELDCARPAVNVSRGMQGTVEERIAELRAACRPEVYEELLRITALDRRLVELARGEVLRRFEMVRPRLPQAAIPRNRVVGRVEVRVAESARRLVRLAPYWRELAGSGREALFDADYYRTSASEQASGRSHPLLDFLLKGAYDGRKPHPLFDPAFYLRKYPDVAAAGINPFCHYLKHGYKELRQPHPLFDTGFYLDRNPDVRAAKLNPLVHYLRHGAAEDRKPHPLFEPRYYRRVWGKSLPQGENPLVHFLEAGAQARSPHPMFDCDAYMDAHPEAAEAGLNPLEHYLNSGGDAAGSVREGVEAASAVEIEVEDFRLTVFCLNGSPDEAWKGGGALVWQDDRGVAQWAAEPQQLPFLRAIGIDQIQAQARGVFSAFGTDISSR